MSQKRKYVRHAAKHIWIDLDNSPHVPFFRPIIEELRARGYRLTLTARDAFQVTELTALHGIECQAIGRHYGKNRFMKVLGLAIRAAQLLPVAIRNRPDLAVSHGSRAQIAVAKLLRIPCILMADYEHAKQALRSDWVFVPEVTPTAVAGRLGRHVLKYPGIKEDVYASDFRPDRSVLGDLGVEENEILVTVRPPATEAHYHNPDSERLFAAAMDLLGGAEGVRTVVLPRNEAQKEEIASRWTGLLHSRKVLIPSRAVDGLSLIWHSDLVISGGGTMNREAAALDVPVYSIFRGKIGSVDRHLAQNGRLVLLETIQDVQRMIVLAKKRSSRVSESSNRRALETILGGIVGALGAPQNSLRLSHPTNP